MSKTQLALIVLILTAPAGTLWCQSQIDADDVDIQYVGRIKNPGTKTPSFDWPAVYIKAVFEGTSLSLRLTEAGGTQNYYNMFIDTLPMVRVQASSSQTVYPVITGISNSTHTVLVTKRTESGWGKCVFNGFVLDNGKGLRTPPASPNRRMEFVGDSFTAGYGNEGVNGYPYTADLQNSYLAYGPVAARILKADYHLIAISGIGVVRNYGDPNPTSAKTMPYYYPGTIEREELADWTFSWVPDVVSVYLGINDYSTPPTPDQQTFENGYYNFVKTIRSKYANAQIFLVYNSVASDPAKTCIQNVIGRLVSEGDAKVHNADINMAYGAGDRGSDGHPSVQGDQKIAGKLIPIITSVMTEWADTTPPSDIATVNDGTGSDIDSTSSPSQLSANWTASTDPDSGISGYKYGIGTIPGGTNITGWTDAGNVLTVNRTGLSLAAGTTYYFSVKAVNGVGLESAAANSDGQVVTPAGAAGNGENIRIYPNPFLPRPGQSMTFTGLSAQSRLRIYTLSGRLVRELNESGGTIAWDGNNSDARAISPGIYVYVLTDSLENKKTGKVVIAQ